MIKETIKKNYNVTAKEIIEIEGGWSAKAYVINAYRKKYFLKVYMKSNKNYREWTKNIDVYAPIMNLLSEQKEFEKRISKVKLTVDGKYKVELKDCTIMLYEFINGVTIRNNDLDDFQKAELGQIIGILHKQDVGNFFDLAPITEDYNVWFCQEILNVLLKTTKVPKDISHLVEQNKVELIQLVENTTLLANAIKLREVENVLCHTDIHGWNLMQGDRLCLIDWEGIKLAPREADLFGIKGENWLSGCYNIVMKEYRKYHPDYEMDMQLYEFYMYRRMAEDIWASLERLIYDDINSEECKKIMNSITDMCRILREEDYIK